MNEIAAAIEYLKTHAENIRAGTYGHAAGTEAWAARVDTIVAGLELTRNDVRDDWMTNEDCAKVAAEMMRQKERT